MKHLYASIRSVDQARPGTKGKTSTVRSYHFKVTTEPGFLHLTAFEPKRRGTGYEGGRVRDTLSDLTVMLNSEALEDIFKHAIAANLFQPTGVEQLKLAQRHLKIALKQLGHARRPKTKSRNA